MASIRKKLATVGDKECGKRCLLIAFSKGQFPENYVVFENCVADIEVDGKCVELVLWDTTGEPNREGRRREGGRERRRGREGGREGEGRERERRRGGYDNN